MLDNETKRRIDTARDILVGKVPDPKSQVEQITIALIYKFMDDMDAEAEELGGERKFFSGEYEQYGWKKLMAQGMGGFEVLTLYAEAIQKLNINPNIPQLFRDIFKNAYLPYRDPQTLKSFLKTIDEFNYDHSERLGDAFEYLLSVLGSQGDAGQFRTPRHIIDFMVYLVDPKKNETILDPACGTAGFLISSYKHIVKSNSSNFNSEEQNDFSFGEINSERHSGDRLTPDERTRLALNVKGYDISPDMVRLSLVNLYLHGFADPKISEYDTLTSEEKWNEHSDIILANPPFMSPKGGIKPHKRFSVESSRSEVLFVDYIAEHLTPNGRAAVIVPEGIIFQSGTAYKTLRKMLVENYLYAVISLPAGVFNPYSGVKTSILLMDKTLAKKTDKILFAKVVNDGFDLGAQRVANGKSDLPSIANGVKDFAQSILNHLEFDTDSYNNMVVATKEKIGENGNWGLSGERYRTVTNNTLAKYEFVKLSTTATFVSGYAFKSEELTNTPGENHLPVIKIGNLTKQGKIDLKDVDYYDYHENLRKFIVNKWDILIAMTGATVGKTAVSDYDNNFLLNQRVGLIRPSVDRVNRKYLAILLLSDDFYNYCQRTAGGGAQGNISPKEILNYEIPLPPLEIQKEIVSEIEGWQKIIDGARQVVENYKPQIEIDPSWEMVELGEVIKLSSGKGLTSAQIIKGEYPVYGGNGINGYHNDYFLENPTVVIGRVGAYCGSIHITKAKSWVTDNGLYLTDLSSSLNIRYLAQILSQLNLNQYAKVGGQPSISQKTVTELKIPIPFRDIQDQIAMNLDKEIALVESFKEIILIFEAKIKAKIAKVWGE